MPKPKKSSKKKPAKKAKTKANSLTKFGMVDSKFIIKLRKEFLGPNPRDKFWTSAFVKSPQAFADDLALAFRWLFLSNEGSTAGLDAGAPGSATVVLVQLLKDTRWPDNDDDYPVAGDWNDDTFRRYEMACAMNILLQAFDREGAAGPREPWPPEKPN